MGIFQSLIPCLDKSGSTHRPPSRSSSPTRRKTNQLQTPPTGKTQGRVTISHPYPLMPRQHLESEIVRKPLDRTSIDRGVGRERKDEKRMRVVGKNRGRKRSISTVGSMIQTPRSSHDDCVRDIIQGRFSVHDHPTALSPPRTSSNSAPPPRPISPDDFAGSFHGRNGVNDMPSTHWKQGKEEKRGGRKLMKPMIVEGDWQLVREAEYEGTVGARVC